MQGMMISLQVLDWPGLLNLNCAAFGAVGVQGQGSSMLTAAAHPLTAAPGQTLILTASPSGCIAAIETTARLVCRAGSAVVAVPACRVTEDTTTILSQAQLLHCRGDARIIWQTQMLRGSTLVGAGICQVCRQAPSPLMLWPPRKCHAPASPPDLALICKGVH